MGRPRTCLMLTFNLVFSCLLFLLKLGHVKPEKSLSARFVLFSFVRSMKNDLGVILSDRVGDLLAPFSLIHNTKDGLEISMSSVLILFLFGYCFVC